MEEMFIGCENLKSISFTKYSSLTSIGDNAFENCVSLKYFVLGYTITLTKVQIILQISCISAAFCANFNIFPPFLSG